MTAAARNPYFVECERWLMSHGEAFAAARLRRVGVHRGAAELVSDAWERLRLHFDRHPDARPEVPADRYAARTIANLAHDLMRGRRRRNEVSLTEGDLGLDERLPAQTSVMSSTSSLADDLRVAVEVVGDGRAWVVSAALTYVTLTMHPNIDTEPAPKPLAGANPDQARMWPCLWFAGHRDDVFPDGDGGSDAQRQRLRRLRQSAEVLLQEARSATRPESPSL